MLVATFCAHRYGSVWDVHVRFGFAATPGGNVRVYGSEYFVERCLKYSVLKILCSLNVIASVSWAINSMARVGLSQEAVYAFAE